MQKRRSSAITRSASRTADSIAFRNSMEANPALLAKAAQSACGISASRPASPCDDLPRSLYHKIHRLLKGRDPDRSPVLDKIIQQGLVHPGRSSDVVPADAMEHNDPHASPLLHAFYEGDDHLLRKKRAATGRHGDHYVPWHRRGLHHYFFPGAPGPAGLSCREQAIDLGHDLSAGDGFCGKENAVGHRTVMPAERQKFRKRFAPLSLRVPDSLPLNSGTQ